MIAIIDYDAGNIKSVENIHRSVPGFPETVCHYSENAGNSIPYVES